MTRAEQRLVICGTAPKSEGSLGIDRQCWYRLIEDALVLGEGAPSIEVPSEDGDGTIMRLRKDVLELSFPAKVVPAPGEAALPGWFDKPMSHEPLHAITMAPSDADEAEWKHGTGEMESEQALERGRLLHRLIQSLPDIAPVRRVAAAEDFLHGNVRTLSSADRAVIISQALAILDDARFAPLFAPGSRAEVPLTGILPRNGLAPYSVTGQIDRLVVTEAEVLIADYKTNRPPPAALDEVPRAYRRQLALYRALLQRIFPDRPVRAALVWTVNATLMELPQGLLDAEVATLTGA